MQLAPHTDTARPLSAIEYFHAATGMSAATLEPPREVIFCVEGRGRIDASRWRGALAQVVAVHPGLRLRVVGERQHARFASDGVPASVRIVHASRWDGLSHVGSDFLSAVSLPYATGPLCELVVEELADSDVCRVWLRASHAAMDGQGAMYALAELFRALRGEPLLGCNAGFSDVDLMRSVRVDEAEKQPRPMLNRAALLTGAPQGDATGNVWQRLVLDGRRPNSLSKLVGAFNACAREHDARLPVLIALPVNLRRHCPGMLSTHNFSSMIYVALAPGEGVDAFKRRWQMLLRANRDAKYRGVAELSRRLPFAWLDRLVNRHQGNFRTRRLFDTAAISHLGYFACAEYSATGFNAERCWGIPLPGSVFALVFGTGHGLDVIVGMPENYAGGGRFERLIAGVAQAFDA